MVEKISPLYILVDFDGTLLNSIDNLYETYLQFLKIYGVKGFRSEFNSLNGPSTLEIIKILKSKYSISGNIYDLCQEYTNLIKANYLNSSPFTDADMFLSSLYQHGVKLILVTSSYSKACIPLIEKFGWNKYFDDFVWGEDVKKSKPFPDIYIEALKKSGVAKKDVMVVEDSINGVKSGASAGLQVLGVSIEFSEDNLMASGASMVFKDLSSTLEFIIQN